MTALVAFALTALFYWRNGRTQRPIAELRIAPFASYAGFQGFPAFSADGKKLFSASRDHTIRSWNVAAAQDAILHDKRAENSLTLRLAPDQQTAAAWDMPGTITVWNQAGTRALHRSGGDFNALVFSPDSQSILFVSDRHGKPAIYQVRVGRFVEETTADTP